jgi:hypothetical protein
MPTGAEVVGVPPLPPVACGGTEVVPVRVAVIIGVIVIADRRPGASLVPAPRGSVTVREVGGRGGAEVLAASAVVELCSCSRAETTAPVTDERSKRT